MAAASRGYVVHRQDGPVWDMEPGRPAAFKLMCETTGGRVAVFEETVPPGAGTPLHIHRASDEIIHVVTGTFDFRLGEEAIRVTGGAWVFIPRGSVRGWRNSGVKDGSMFFIFAPGAGALAFEELRHHELPLGEIDAVTRDEVFRRNGYELISQDW